ncbi:MAG TPA: hypothetical protein PKM88_07550 [bacterium]|nr:hypothetical protein [bacterium]
MTTIGSGRAAGWVALLFAALYLLTAGGHYYSQDGKELWRVTCSIVHPPLFASQYGIVPSLLGLPLYGLGALAAQAGLTDGSADAQAFFGSLLNPLVTGALLGLFYGVAAQFYAPRRAFILALGLGLGTLLWPYSKYDFYEPVATLLLLGLAAVLWRWRRTGCVRTALLAGVVCGIMLHTRLDSLLLFPVAGFYLLVSGRPRPEQWRALGWLTAGFVPFVLLAAGFNYARFGSIIADPRLAQESFSTPLWYGLYGQLLSPGRSLFFYSPVIILTLFGWRAWWRAHRPELLFIVAVTLLYLLLYGQWCNWSANWCYGNRYLLKVLPLLMLPVGSVLGRGRPAGNVAFIILALLGIGLQVMAVAVEFNDPLIEMLAVINTATDYAQVDPLMAVPVWNVGIIDGRGVMPALYDFGWLHLRGYGLVRGWLVVPLLLVLLLFWMTLKLRGLLAGIAPWLALTLLLALLAALQIGYGANSGKQVTLSACAPGATEPYFTMPVRDINFVDYFGQWQRRYSLTPGSTLVWRGVLDCPVGGVGYRFGLMAHGPATMTLGGVQLLQVSDTAGTHFVSAPTELLKGRYPVEVRYTITAEPAPPARVTLYWWLPYTSLSVIYGEHFTAGVHAGGHSDTLTRLPEPG